MDTFHCALKERGIEHNGSIKISSESDGTSPDGEFGGPPGFSMCNHIQSSHIETKLQQPVLSERRSPEGGEPGQSYESLGTEDADPSTSPGFSSLEKCKQPS
ncbi:hypothetical protein Ancab_032560 [Ancistrocladus abbreviatus]